MKVADHEWLRRQRALARSVCRRVELDRTHHNGAQLNANKHLTQTPDCDTIHTHTDKRGTP